MPKNIGRDEVQKKIEAGATVLEALPASYYEDKHLPGALNFPLDDVDKLAGELLQDKSAEIVVYCTDTTCNNSGIAATRLEELGYTNVHKYAAGKSDWIAAGLPTESGPAAKA
ncbi:rhodanese-like domain-containing protein [Streptantibioticus rubrisoli]|uniref:Rhodanese-like domain-containing protein n=1 Tax=Streptantibioticus rubrisoli TaxID=1387313 RepID=A0ABT1P7X0_9ACTN|nr:rhodanese-like domain-containing protein [Streptantibioticus rubrisoli]MCQ4041472.1 rhodanese-like domain-containing protein [Streptantibioticus rubrisoli]